jgi:hypothetical protein
MDNPRFVVAIALSALALALAIFGTIGGGPMAGAGGHASLAASHFVGLSGIHVPGLIALGSSVAAFALSLGQRSYIMAGLLTTAGILYSLHLGPLLGDHSVIAIVGPITGLIFGHTVLALGVAKGIGSLRNPVARMAR